MPRGWCGCWSPLNASQLFLGECVGTSGVLWTEMGCLSFAPPSIDLALGPGSHTAMGGPGWSQQTDPSGNRKILSTLAVLSGPPRWGVEQAHERGFEVCPGQALEQGLGHPSTGKYLHPSHCRQHFCRKRVRVCWLREGRCSPVPLSSWKLVSLRELLGLPRQQRHD